MPTEVLATVFGGLFFPDSLTRSEFFGVLTAFVAINTIIYASLAVANILPKIYPADWIHKLNRRSETRGIHPDGS